MQTHSDFIFNLDEPLEQPTAADVTLRGWITAHQPIGVARLCGESDRNLAFEERPDVRVAFPAFAFVAGFKGTVSRRDLRNGALHLAFGRSRVVIQALAPPPQRPPFVRRAWLHLRRAVEFGRLRLSDDPRKRWRAALRVFVLEIELTRNGNFRRQEVDRLLALFAEFFPDAVVVQIGANDGATGDPISHLFEQTRWSGLLVEPIPALCEALTRRYRDRAGVHVEQVAISETEGDAPIYRLESIPGATPEWFNQLATLDRDVLLKHRASIPEIESLIVEERTPTARLDTLLARHGLAHIDLLVIDTEGHDYQILKQVDFRRLRPLLVLFEHQHLSTNDKNAAYALLKRSGYASVETAEGDAIAWLR